MPPTGGGSPRSSGAMGEPPAGRPSARWRRRSLDAVTGRRGPSPLAALPGAAGTELETEPLTVTTGSGRTRRGRRRASSALAASASSRRRSAAPGAPRRTSRGSIGHPWRRPRDRRSSSMGTPGLGRAEASAVKVAWKAAVPTGSPAAIPEQWLPRGGLALDGRPRRRVRVGHGRRRGRRHRRRMRGSSPHAGAAQFINVKLY